MKKLLVACACIFLSLPSIDAQKKSSQEDVIHLKNEWVIRGEITARNADKITIETRDGNIYVFKNTEIDTITKEAAYGAFTYKKKGFASYTELGPLIAGKTTQNGVTTAAFSLQTINGYRFSQYAMTGIGAGADLYAAQTILPVFGSFRGDIATSGTVLPFYFAEAGNGFNITQNSSGGQSFKGGLMYAAGLGIKIPFNRNAGFLLSMGYRYQKTSYTFQNTGQDILYKRIAVRAGFFL
jgi:hypothetical protein